jgi:hypothetical protein
MKLLYNTLTERLQPYPRADDEDVVGLSPEYLTMQVVNAAQPTFDAGTEMLVPAQTIDTTTKTVTNGWTIAPKPEPVSLPVSVTMRSLRLALIAQNLYQATVAAINGIPDAAEKLKAQVWWSTSPIVLRDNPYVISIGSAVGKSPQDIDEIFTTAKTLDFQQP